MEPEMPLRLEGIVEKVHDPRPLKDKTSPGYGKIHTEFEMEQELKWRGSKRIKIKHQSFWGELPKEMEGHNIMIYSDGNNQAIYDTVTDVWYESNPSQN